MALALQARQLGDDAGRVDPICSYLAGLIVEALHAAGEPGARNPHRSTTPDEALAALTTEIAAASA